MGIYGHNEERASALRTKRDGLLKSHFIGSEEYPPINNNGNDEELVEMDNSVGRLSNIELHAAGDVRANENPALFTLHTLFLREHNRIARSMSNSGKTDEEIFQTARKMIRAFIQRITFEQYIPSIIGKKLPRYSGYNEEVDATIRNFFSTVTYRFGHDMINSVILRLDEKYVPIKSHGN